MEFLPLLVDLVLLAIVGAGVFYLIELYQKNQNIDPYDERRLPNAICIEREFTAKTLAGFKVRYHLEFLCYRRDNEEFIQSRMLDESIQKAVAFQFNNDVFLRKLEENNCFFHLELDVQRIRGEICLVPHWAVYQVCQEEGGLRPREIPDSFVQFQIIAKEPYRDGGCDIELSRFVRNIYPRELIEENYRMLSDEIKEAILTHPYYGSFQESLVVMALKERQKMLGDRNQKYEAEHFQIETELAARGLRIIWRFKTSAPGGYELLGFRRSDGFGPDQFDERQNGVMVVHSRDDGEMVELLSQGMAYYYTFYLQSTRKNEQGHFWVASPLRFQTAIPMDNELAQIRSMLDRVERLKAERENSSINKALKEVDLYFELDKNLDVLEKKRVAEILASDASDEEKRKKIQRLRAVVADVRDRYEQ